MTAILTIHGSYSSLSGDYPFSEVREATSWLVEGHRYAQSFKKGLWDGRKHLFNAKSGAFPTGLVQTVKDTLEATNTPYLIQDLREDPYDKSKDINELKNFELGGGISFTGKYSYQLEACQKSVVISSLKLKIMSSNKTLKKLAFFPRYDCTLAILWMM